MKRIYIRYIDTYLNEVGLFTAWGCTTNEEAMTKFKKVMELLEMPYSNPVIVDPNA